MVMIPVFIFSFISNPLQLKMGREVELGFQGYISPCAKVVIRKKGVCVHSDLMLKISVFHYTSSILFNKDLHYCMTKGS